MCIVVSTQAQTPSLTDSVSPANVKHDSLLLCQKESTDKDIVDVFKWVLQIKPKPPKCEPSKKAGKLDIAFLPGASYAIVTGFGGVISANGAYYADNDPQTKLSAISTSLGYTQNNQIIVPIIANLWTKKNKYNILSDWRYYKYPEYTYGLGGHTSITDNADKIDYSNLIIHQGILKHITGSELCVGMAYNLNYHWNVNESGAANGQPSDFQKYGFSQSSFSSGFSLNALYDSRKNSINPSDATYASLYICPNTKLLGSDNNYTTMLLDMRKYINMGKRNVLAFWSYDWLMFNGNAPYLDLPSTGWDPFANMGRGYVQSRLRGKNLVYLESEFRFALVPSGLVGGVVFANAQSVTDWPSNQFSKIYPAIGTGLRIKVNKHSNTNICLDYAWGINGSNGVFINLGEVF
ncbi:MAG TPA: BamA/TamA family outer membrane protein [Bacteroidia bacterium]|nr:BamA/TamA family outer membrane protein [Bacteroidia bacterium]